MAEQWRENLAKRLGRLNPWQRAIVDRVAQVDEDPLVALRVLACAGSGKSTSLVAATGRILAENLLAPRDVIVTTFTRKAADELIDKLQEVTSPQLRGGGPRINTYHALALGWLRSNDPEMPPHRWAPGRNVDLPNGRDAGIPRNTQLWSSIIGGWPPVLGTQDPNEYGKPKTGLNLKEKLGYSEIPSGKNYATACGVIASYGLTAWDGEAAERATAFQGVIDPNTGRYSGVFPHLLDAWKLFEEAKQGLKAYDFADALYAYWKRGTDKTKLMMVDECFPGDTPILLADGKSVRSIKDIVESGDRVDVLSFDETAGQQVVRTVTGGKKVPLQRGLRRLTLTDKRHVVCTEDHRIYVYGLGWISMHQIHAGNLVRVGNDPIPVASNELILVSDVMVVYDLEVNGTHCYYANGILVHNCQDNSWIQLDLARQITNRGNGRLVIIGDLRQAIYKFRGAEPEITQNADKVLNAETMEIPTNYRSGWMVVDAGNAIARGEEWAIGTEAIAARRDELPDESRASEAPQGEIVIRRGDDTPLHEASTTAKEIRELLDLGTPPSAIAVLIRTNKQAAVYEMACLLNKVPVLVLGATNSFFDRYEVKDAVGLCYLTGQVPTTPESRMETLSRVWRKKGRFKMFKNVDFSNGLGPLVARYPKVSDALRAWGNTTPFLRGRNADRYSADLDELTGEIEAIESSEWPQTAHHAAIILASKLGQSAEDESAVERAVAEQEGGDASETDLMSALVDVAKEFGSFAEMMAFASKLSAWVLAITSLDNVPADKKEQIKKELRQRVVVSTVHRSKGLEFKHVYVSATHKTFPHFRSWDHPEQMSEEKRLFYVACTRAEDRLVLTCSEIDDRMKPTGPSEFITDLVEPYVRRIQRGIPRWEDTEAKLGQVAAGGWALETTREMWEGTPSRVRWTRGEEILGVVDKGKGATALWGLSTSGTDSTGEHDTFDAALRAAGRYMQGKPAPDHRPSFDDFVAYVASLEGGPHSGMAWSDYTRWLKERRGLIEKDFNAVVDAGEDFIRAGLGWASLEELWTDLAHRVDIPCADEQAQVYTIYRNQDILGILWRLPDGRLAYRGSLALERPAGTLTGEDALRATQGCTDGAERPSQIRVRFLDRPSVDITIPDGLPVWVDGTPEFRRTLDAYVRAGTPQAVICSACVVELPPAEVEEAPPEVASPAWQIPYEDYNRIPQTVSVAWGSEDYTKRSAEVELRKALSAAPDTAWRIVPSGDRFLIGGVRELTWDDKRRIHAESVKAAVEAGLPVPANVLVDYPDLCRDEGGCTTPEEKATELRESIPTATRARPVVWTHLPAPVGVPLGVRLVVSAYPEVSEVVLPARMGPEDAVTVRSGAVVMVGSKGEKDTSVFRYYRVDDDDRTPGAGFVTLIGELILTPRTSEEEKQVFRRKIQEYIDAGRQSDALGEVEDLTRILYEASSGSSLRVANGWVSVSGVTRSTEGKVEAERRVRMVTDEVTALLQDLLRDGTLHEVGRGTYSFAADVAP